MKSTQTKKSSTSTNTRNSLEIRWRYNIFLKKDDEIYELIIKYNFDDKRIRDSILDNLENIKKRGEDYNWTLVEKGKSNMKYLIRTKSHKT